MSRALLCIVLLFLTSAVSTAQPEQDTNRGRTPLDNSEADRIGYRKSWALIIGIDYNDPERSQRDRIVLPELRNAETDATALRNLLISHYGYSPDNVISNDVGSKATYQWIQESLRRLCDPNEVSPEDSVLVFFSGHGDRVDSTKDPGALYPYDVRFSGGTPQPTTYIRVHSDLTDVVASSPARHKLIILDSCYSGEIFNVGAHPRSEVDDRSSLALAEASCLQALTSCRSTQVASDGRGEHSPFTKGLLDALRQLPARHDNERIWTNWLFAYMRPNLTLPNGQCPDCRNLQGDGEFGFFPDRSKDWAKEFLPSAADYQMLQVSAGSEQGQWWFEETPWFLPALRQPILKTLDPSRSGIANLRMNRDRLKDAARDWLSSVSVAQASAEQTGADAEYLELMALRRKHLGLLMYESSQNTRDLALETIVADLSAPEMAEKLEPEDRHLLAVVQHKLSLPEAEQTYLRVLDEYEKSSRSPGSPETAGSAESTKSGNALLALCKADFGEYLLQNPSQHFGADASKAAARYFREASEECEWQGPASFNIFIRCREADAWLSQNRWYNADLCQRDALDLAKGIGPEHYLTAFVHRRRAWAQMTKWEISKAEQSFRESNRILADWMAVNDSVDAESPDYEATEPSEPRQESALLIDDRVRNSGDHQARIAFFHNLHGLAMAQRFHSRTEFACRNYRGLAMELEHALGQVRRRRSADGNVETDLLQRLINTLERLADCNLFGDPGVRDISEAIDDYDRASSRIHLLTPNQRKTWQSRLSWKQALALALPSPVQDPELAVELTVQADELFADRRESARGMDQALSVLVTPMVNLLAAANPIQGGTSEIDSLSTARTTLRSTLQSYRDVIGANPHRDQLELCLFASDLLVRYGQESNPLLAMQDTDLLLSFCRVPLAPYRRSAGKGTSISDSRRYLRPYYDTAIASLMQSDDQATKKLLRLQWESTRGSVCPKPEVPVPVVAIYILRNEPYLMYSLPDGPFSVLSLGDGFSAEEIIAACQNEEAGLLPLPRRAEQDFEAWHLAHAEREQQPVEVRLCPEAESDDFLHAPAQLLASTDAELRVAKKPVAVRFPFSLPDGFTPKLPESL
ncbi:MAG: hypothetical protein Fues2KO_50300 [Fuerstiella sp.]